MENWIKRRRQQLNMSQEDLMAKLQLAGYDVSRATIGHWETGRNKLPLKDVEFVKALSDILFMPVPVILRSAGMEFNTQHAEISEEIAYIADELPPDKQDLLLRIAQQFTKMPGE